MKYQLIGGMVALLIVCSDLYAGNDAVIEEVAIKVVDEQSWDSVIGGFLGGRGVLGLLPDVKFCFESTNTPQTCSQTCNDSRTCSVQIRRLAQRNIKMTVVDVDGSNYQPMATFVVPDASKCTSQPCSFTSSPSNVVVQFRISYNQNYNGAYRGTLGTPRVSKTPARTTRRTPAPSKAAGPEKALSEVRGVTNCEGSDHFFPSGTVFYVAWFNRLFGKEDTSELRKLAAFGAAIDDQKARAAFKVKARRWAENHAMDNQFDLVWGNVETSRDYDEVGRMAITAVAALAIEKGLSKYIRMPTVRDRGSLADSLENWAYRQIASGWMATKAVNWLMAPTGITPECVYNEMSKLGLENMMK